jgi:hypothetical protein
MQPAKINYKIYQGSTFQETLRWESETKGYATISAITKAAPCVLTTAANHTIPVGWRIRVVGVAGMKEINSLGDDSFYLVTGTTGTTLSLNRVNSLGYTAYTSGGVIEYNTPVPLTGYTAQMQIRETLESSSTIFELTSSMVAGSGITINSSDSTILVTISAAATRAFDFDTAVYSLELTDASGVVTPFLSGNITLVREVTR